MKEYAIKVSTNDGIWLTGTINGYPFWTKVCDKRSGFGINGGRVIKLLVRSKIRGKELFSYERGWDKRPKTARMEDICRAILLFCETLPRQEVWRETLRHTRIYSLTEGGGRRHDP